MFTAIARILRTIHIIPPAKVDPVRTRPSGTEAEATAVRPAEATVTAALVSRDDTGREVRKVEPAMAGMPASSFSLRESRPGAPPRGPGEEADAMPVLPAPTPPLPFVNESPTAASLTDASGPTIPSKPKARTGRSSSGSRKPPMKRPKD